jgi:hypothetical protein
VAPVCITLMAVAGQVLWGSWGEWKRDGGLSGGEYELGFAFDCGGMSFGLRRGGVHVGGCVLETSVMTLRIGVFCWILCVLI